MKSKFVSTMPVVALFLIGSSSIDDVLSRLSAVANRIDGWIQGVGFDQDKLKERRFPNRHFG